MRIDMIGAADARDRDARVEESGRACWAIVGLLLTAVLLCSGCASDRYFTAEEDALGREACQPAGCVFVPAPLWKKVQELLRMLAPRSQPGTGTG